MNNTFSYKRFIQLEKYNISSTKDIVLFIFAIISSTYIIALYLNLSSEFDSAQYIRIISLLLFILAPCLFEKPDNRYNSDIKFILPASTLEKYIHIWIRYYVIVPIVIIATIVLFNLLVSTFFVADKEFTGNIIDLKSGDYTSWWLTFIFQAIFFIGSIFFKNNILIKSLIVTIGLFVTTIIIVNIFLQLLPDEIIINNLFTYPIFSFPISAELSTLLSISVNSNAIFIIGLWVSGYFIMKEKEL